jgi:hypothetical protein
MQGMQAGDEQHCPRCRAWHVLEQRHVEGVTAYERMMLYVTCRGERFYVGMIGQPARLPTRPAASQR